MAALACLAGAVLLVIATVATVIHINVVTVTKATYSGWHFTGPGLVIIALAAIPMLGGSLRGSRPAAGAVALLGVVALVLVLTLVQPNVHDTGVYGQDYDQAAAGPAFGYYAETLGSLLVLLSGVILFLLAPSQRRPAPEPAAAASDAAASTPAASDPAAGDPHSNVPDTPL